jgi:hypothetical protein
MSDSKILLVESILLLFRESQLPEATDRSTELVKEVEGSILIPEAAMETSVGRETLISLRAVLSYMLEQPSTYKFNRESLLQRLRVAVGNETYLYDVIRDGMEELDDPEQISSACRTLRTNLRTHISKSKVREIVKEASQAVLFNEKNVNWRDFVPTLVEKLEPYTRSIVANDESNKLDELDLADADSVSNTIAEGQKEASAEGIMKTGWQGVNDMTGLHQGFRRGDTILLSALQHNFKSGFLMNVPKQVALYNKPHMLDPTKKPLIIYISLENNISDNILQFYRTMYGVETGENIDIRLVDKNKAAAYIKEKLSVNGYHFKMLRFNGSEFNYRSFYDLLDKYRAEGYEIHMVSLDYLMLMSLDGCSGSNEAFMKKDLLRRLRNYCNPKKITLLTAAQLSTDAKNMTRQGVENFVKEIANKGYYDGCRGLDQEPDLEIVIHIEKPGDGFAYLTMMRGKHRGELGVTPEKNKFVVYRFEPYGLPEDINGKNLCRRTVGGGMVSDVGGGDAPWWSSAEAS